MILRHLLSSLFLRRVPPTQAEYFLPALGESAVKREFQKLHFIEYGRTILETLFTKHNIIHSRIYNILISQGAKYPFLDKNSIIQ